MDEIADMYDRYDDEQPSRTSTCKRCGKSGLHWEHDGEGWVLMASRYGVHKCNEAKVAKLAADDFDKLE